MQWYVLGLFACFLNVQGGVLKCSSDDPTSCAKETDYPGTEAFEEECLPGSQWESNCHSCRCTGAGLAECTRQEFCTGVVAQPIRCKPFVQFKRSCNTCVCLEDGLALCSLKVCRTQGIPQVEIPTEESSELESEYGNPYETEFQDHDTEYDVPHIKAFENNNVDDDSNIFEETYTNYKNNFNNDQRDDYNFDMRLKDRSIEEMDEKIINVDHKTVNDDHSIIKRSVCQPNHAFTTDCNACKCAPDGQSYRCTHNECMDGATNKEVEVFMENEGVDHIESHSVCKPRGTFYIGCNTCHCNTYGNDYSCTNKPCPLPEDVELFHELRDTKSSKDHQNSTQKIVCVANRMFIKDCNTCWCNEDGTGFFCTRRVCVNEFPDDDKPEELRILIKECRPDEVFELDCNMCRCNPDGKSYSCTRRACVEPVDEDLKNTTLIRKTRGAQETPAKNCEPGQKFRLDCNNCLCDDRGQDFVCTRIDCTAPSFTPPRTKRDTSEQVKMECSPNSVFDRDCNVCRCTADGHYAVCTIKRCSSSQGNSSQGTSSQSTSSQDSSNQDSSSSQPSEGGDSDFRCNPGEQFKRGCNDCSCSADGKNILCTVRFCDQDITPPSF